MANKVQKPCRVCGKMFYPCVDCAKDKTMFHWRAVACSIECAKKYFEKVEEARKPKQEIKNEEPKTENIIPEEVVEEKVEKQKKMRKQFFEENKEESEKID